MSFDSCMGLYWNWDSWSKSGFCGNLKFSKGVHLKVLIFFFLALRLFMELSLAASLELTEFSADSYLSLFLRARALAVESVRTFGET